jgi:hypothetical protein
VHLDGVAAHAELAAAERHVVAVELQVDERRRMLRWS